MSYAEQGAEALIGQITAAGGEPESPFERAVATALEAHGLEVVAQVGVGGYRIDLAIRDTATGRYVLGIECDRATYHAGATARDRGRLRQQVLERLGWRIHRIWSSDWIRDPSVRSCGYCDDCDTAWYSLNVSPVCDMPLEHLERACYNPYRGMHSR